MTAYMLGVYFMCGFVISCLWGAYKEMDFSLRNLVLLNIGMSWIWPLLAAELIVACLHNLRENKK